MEQLIETALYKEALILIREKGVKFTIDDLCGAIRISKKTFYAWFPSKGDFAQFVYTKAFKAFDDALSQIKTKDKLNATLFEAFCNLETITDEKTFNLYSINAILEEKASIEFTIREKMFSQYLTGTRIGKSYFQNKAFLISVESTLASIGKTTNSVRIINDYVELLENLR